ncbi:MAG: hypothetical protein ABII25_06805, partial [bacterium]
MKKLILFLIFLIIFVFSKSYGHDNNVIHPFTLTGRAWMLLEDKTKPTGGGKSPYDELKNYFYDTTMPEGYDLGNGDFDTSKIEKAGTFGTCDEDEPVTKTRNHFYDYLTKKGWLSVFQSAVDRGKELWDKSLTDYKCGNIVNGYYQLGCALHLLEDMSVPSHAQ